MSLLSFFSLRYTTRRVTLTAFFSLLCVCYCILSYMIAEIRRCSSRPLCSPSWSCYGWSCLTSMCSPRSVVILSFFLFFCGMNHVYFPAQLVSQEDLPSATFWTSRGHRCHPFLPPVSASIFVAHRVQHSRFLSIHASNFAIQRSRAFRYL